MPSILNNLISLDTNTAPSALRLVVYRLPEESRCPWPAWDVYLALGFAQHLWKHLYLQHL